MTKNKKHYNFKGLGVAYICGMSVPPVMTKRVVERLIATGVFEKKGFVQ